MKVLVPLDESNVSLAIMPSLQRLAALSPDTEFHFMTVADPDDARVKRMREITQGSSSTGIASSVGPVVRDPYPKIVERKDQAIDRVEDEESHWLHEIHERELPGARAQYHVDWGDDVGETIIMRANEIGADLIAMATHARKGIRRAIVGSVTEKVIRDAGRPVLIVAPGED